MKKVKRRDFLKKGSLLAGGATVLPGFVAGKDENKPIEFDKEFKNDVSKQLKVLAERGFNETYSGDYLNRVAFPIGGLGTGMFCMEGTGCLSHFSIRHKPDIFNEPFMLSAISIKGEENGAKVLEGPVPSWKIFGKSGSANGLGGSSYGYPRFKRASFDNKFPFGDVHLRDENYPLDVDIKAWNPFIPTDEDNSSIPVGALEYTFKNNSNKNIEAVFSFHAFNFLRISDGWRNWKEGDAIGSVKNGFVLSQKSLPGNPEYEGHFAVFTNSSNTVVDHKLFSGGWFDTKTILWKDIENGNLPNDPETNEAEGASLYLPINLAPNEKLTVPLMFSWYVPYSRVRTGLGENEEYKELEKACLEDANKCEEFAEMFYKPWYAARFKNINEVVDYWRSNYDGLKKQSKSFSDSFFNQTLPSEVIEAISANLSILKSTTVLRLQDGKFWAFEGSSDNSGCCHGSCTHVWNYAQAVSRLFPRLERSLRETEFFIDQNEEGHQNFRSTLPLQNPSHGFHAASDGQLGGPMKVYREWRISGDTNWMKKHWPKVKDCIDYCIRTWDPKGKGILEEPHHNTYDIEFWGPDGMCTSFYLGALFAAIKMGKEVGDDVTKYETLLEKGKKYLESELYDGEYFIQKIQWEGLEAESPLENTEKSFRLNYSDEARELLMKEGPKYQYGVGCLSDGILGCWIAKMCGLEDFIDNEKVKSHLLAVYKYNFKKDLTNHINPQRPTFALGNDGGLLLCSWPKGGKLSLPFVYSNEVWTGIEYQVASHLIEMGEIEKGLDIVQEVRKRYDGRVRNPFNEYECGSWYARALACYGLIESLTGVRYDAVDQVLYIESKIGNNFNSFFSCEQGFGSVGLKEGKPFLKMEKGSLEVKKCLVSGNKMKLIVS